MVMVTGDRIGRSSFYCRESVLAAVRAERVRQEELKAAGRFKHTAADNIDPMIKFGMLGEEYGEVARESLAVLGLVQEEADPEKLYKELIQVAAIAVAWAESLHDGA